MVNSQIVWNHANIFRQWSTIFEFDFRIYQVMKKLSFCSLRPCIPKTSIGDFPTGWKVDNESLQCENVR